MSLSRSALGVLLGLTLAACGGGSTGIGVSPQVQGKVTVRNGSPDALGGVFVGCAQNGDTVVTGADGSFSLDVPAGESVTIHFEDPLAVDDGTETDGKDCEESDDPAKDDEDVKGGDVVIEPLDDGEVCEIEVEIEDGKVVECRVHSEDGSESGEGRLEPGEGCDEGGVGEVEVGREGDCFFVEVEVDGLAGPAVFDVFLVNKDGQEAFLGVFEVNGEGKGHFELGTCKLDSLPFGAETLEELAGFGLVVRNREDGAVVFEGTLPGLGVDEKDEEEHEGKDEEETGEEEKDEHEGDEPGTDVR